MARHDVGTTLGRHAVRIEHWIGPRFALDFYGMPGSQELFQPAASVLGAPEQAHSV